MKAHELLPGERVLASCSRHWVVLVRPIATSIVAMAVALVVAALLPIAGELRLFLMLGVIVAGLAVLNLYYWGWQIGRAHV